jgi:Sec-independent protein secretion pathway component TatC
MSHRFVLWLLKCYPAGWRSEYGPELEDILRRQSFSIAVVCDVLAGALRERVRRPWIRFLLFSFPVCGFIFSTAMLFAGTLWRMMADPVTQVLRDQGVRPPLLVSLRPLEQLEVIYLGIPLFVTAFAAYPCLLCLAWRSLARWWDGPARSLFVWFALWSSTLGGLSFAGSLLAWQHGSLAWLLAIAPETRASGMLSIDHCFELLAASTLGVTAILQSPLLIALSWRARMRRTAKS